MRRVHVNEILFHSIDPKLVNFLSSKRKKHASSESVSPSDTTEAMETEQCKQIKEKVPKGGMTFTAILLTVLKLTDGPEAPLCVLGQMLQNIDFINQHCTLL